MNALIGQRTDQVEGGRNTDPKHRWLATTLLDIEPRLWKVTAAIITYRRSTLPASIRP